MKIARLLLGVGAIVALGVGAAAAVAWRPAMAPMGAPPRFEAAEVQQGAQLAAIGDCSVCHAGANGRAYAGGEPVQTPFGKVYATNITPDRETGIGTWTEAAFRRSMREGVGRDGRYLYPAFPYTHYTVATDDDIRAIYAFLMTREPVRAVAPETRLPFPLNVRLLMAGWNALFLRQGPEQAAGWTRGKYLVEGLGHCGACHSPRNALGAEVADRAYTGGMADGWVAPGLTAASSPAAAAWTTEAVFAYLRRGEDARHAAAAGPMRAVSHNLRAVPEQDVRAMAAYVASMGAGTVATVSPGGAPENMEGAAIFAGACAGCHGAGAPAMLAGQPSLAASSSVRAETGRNATQVVLSGIRPAMGEAGPYMPGFGGVLTDAQVAAVLDYVRATYTGLPRWTGLEHGVRRIREGS